MSETLKIAKVRIDYWDKEPGGYYVAIDAECDGDEPGEWRYFGALLPGSALTVDHDGDDFILTADTSTVEWCEYVDGEPAGEYLLDAAGADIVGAAIGDSTIADHLIDAHVEYIEDSHAEMRAWGEDVI